MASQRSAKQQQFSPFREHLYEIIFEADTKIGRLFDIVLLICILGSVIAVMLETVPSFAKYVKIFLVIEWAFTIFFTIEYFLRIYTVHSPKKYITSFFGLVDLASIIPSYLSLFIVGTPQGLMILRALRLLRVFRIFNLGNLLFEGQVIIKALKESRDKILVFMYFIVVIVTIFGSVIYFIEKSSPIGHPGFTSIPKSVYWAVVTLSTVGYGDISPNTPLGQFLSSLLMILAYAVIAVPTGIVTAEFSKGKKRKAREKFSSQVCSFCLKGGHENDADYCKFCGEHLHMSHIDDEYAILREKKLDQKKGL
jgi:voltage-gated potassium channel